MTSHDDEKSPWLKFIEEHWQEPDFSEKMENARMIDVITEYNTGAILQYTVVFPGDPGYEGGMPIPKKYFKPNMSGRSAAW